ncbi:hypothetical protein QNO00_12860 [Arthrobacter sp. zg-Y1219]|uniref:hypothetical protein n=1 Tax=Arthrobacter sp. zg-Y1219 TaxID=3049067 RepID=UPI0024C252BE|nr:hypothetical protein [Arthrobacter sp. zg-Y1219]MDK1361150.1 hypothetical protein [Arthrobacter sp. zg-Y1219]
MENKRPNPSLIRLFPGWANSPVWIPGGPVDLEDSLLTRELTEDLLAWEARYYAARPQDPSNSGSTGNDPGPRERQYLADGKDLAERLAAQLGHSFAVSFESGLEEHYVTRSGDPATNPASARFFAEEFEEAAAEEERLRAAGPLHAYAPLSGETFSPSPGDSDQP